jgi:hypothetical protein
MQIENFLGVVEFVRSDSVDVGRVLKAGADILNRNGASWYLAFGSALGFYRDGDIIPQDTDIDVAVLVDDNTPEEFFERLLDDFKKEFRYLRSVKKDDKQHQSAFLHENGFIFDLCFYYPNNGARESFCEGGRWEDRVTGIRMIDTRYGAYPIPENIEEYLSGKYGDWRIKQDKKATKL